MRKTVYVSDLSGEEIGDEDGANILIRWKDPRKGSVELDVTHDEALSLAQHGKKVARRGRRPKIEVVPSE